MIAEKKLKLGPKMKTDKGDGLWLMSFSDMSLILLSFFALMLSASKIDKQRFEHIQDGMAAKEEVSARPERNLKQISEQISQAIAARHLDQQAKVVLDAEGLAIEFSDRLVFQSGSANPHPDFVSVTDQVMSIIAESPDKYGIKIEGHTDDVPLLGTGQFKNNWDLSSARALALVDQFRGRGVDEKRMSLCAYAHTRPRVSTLSLTGPALEQARSSNRRVVIRLE